VIIIMEKNSILLQKVSLRR